MLVLFNVATQNIYRIFLSRLRYWLVDDWKVYMAVDNRYTYEFCVECVYMVVVQNFEGCSDKFNTAEVCVSHYTQNCITKMCN
jgi:hypothetical protein